MLSSIKNESRKVDDLLLYAIIALRDSNYNGRINKIHIGFSSIRFEINDLETPSTMYCNAIYNFRSKELIFTKWKSNK